ncbi:MAG: ferritin-like domain-containing protein [Solirubrobacteraceae bacterium]
MSRELSALMRRRGGCESAQRIVNVAVTAEALAVTALGEALQSATGQGATIGGLALDSDQQQSLRASRAEEHAHYKFFLGAGAKPSTKTFTLPDKFVTDVPTFLTTLIALEEVFIATYIAAAQEFAILGRSNLAELALAIGSIESAHRVHARLFAIDAGVISGVPNNIGFQQAKFDSAGKAVSALRALGFIDGGGQRITYPGPGAIDNTGIHHLTP